MTKLILKCYKIKHKDEYSAKLHLERLAKTDPDAEYLEIYHCWCNSWHVGHSKSKPVRDKIKCR